MTDPAEISEAERERLRRIAELDLTSTEVDEVLQELTRKASRALDLPIALVSIVLDGAQYFAAAQGLGGWIEEARGTPVEWSFCQHAVRDQDTFVVEDAARDERVKESPLVSQDGIGCYLGVPLVSDGHAVGTLCVIGPSPRTFSDEDREIVTQLAKAAVEHIEKRKRA